MTQQGVAVATKLVTVSVTSNGKFKEFPDRISEEFEVRILFDDGEESKGYYVMRPTGYRGVIYDIDFRDDYLSFRMKDFVQNERRCILKHKAGGDECWTGELAGMYFSPDAASRFEMKGECTATVSSQEGEVRVKETPFTGVSNKADAERLSAEIGIPVDAVMQANLIPDPSDVGLIRIMDGPGGHEWSKLMTVFHQAKGAEARNQAVRLMCEAALQSGRLVMEYTIE